MKLPFIPLNITQQLKEFDAWITSSLGEIKDTKRFQDEMDIVEEVFGILGKATNNFADLTKFSVRSVAEFFVDLLAQEDDIEAIKKILNGLASVLFLVSGKSDNNVKCQLPIHFQNIGWQEIPAVRSSKGKLKISTRKLPRTLEAIDFMNIIINLKLYDIQESDTNLIAVSKDYQLQLLEKFIGFILSEDSYIAQLWSIGHSYFALKPFGTSRSLLTPLVIFQVRGSVAASGGHEPEKRLRKVLEDWGLKRDIDFNLNDVVVEKFGNILVQNEIKESNLEPSEELVEGSEVSTEEKIKGKTRAYDFVLPYKTDGWKPQILIQSQFYTGDAGGVSHKNVDQTDKSRSAILQMESGVVFVEYVDGAGYFSSLNGDLKKLLEKPTTGSFFQVRSAAIRLRRELQKVGFLLPLELEHSILRTDGSYKSVQKLLNLEGYSNEEIERCLRDCVQRNIVIENIDKTYLIKPTRREFVRRYFILDVIANFGSSFNPLSKEMAGVILISGYGAWYGLKQDEMVRKVFELAPTLRKDWSNLEIAFSDIRWLSEQGLVMTR
jgi:hypothetical protein